MFYNFIKNTIKFIKYNNYTEFFRQINYSEY